MRPTHLTVAVLVGIALVNCGGDEPVTAPGPAPATASVPASAVPSTPKPPKLTTPATYNTEATYEWGGKWYTARFFTCAQRIWDGRVAQWNQLPQAQRDRWSGSEVWMKSKGWPVTVDETLLAPATRKACPPGR